MSDEIGSTVEVWKTIPDYPNYSVSTFGRVRRDVTVRGKHGGILKPRKSRFGYNILCLCNGGGRSFHAVHRLVLMAFCGHDPLKPICHHIDHNRQNNALSNLEWSTYSKNNSDRIYRITSLGEGHHRHKLTEAEVREIRRLYAAGGISQWRIADMFGVHQTCVSMLVLMKKWKHVV